MILPIEIPEAAAPDPEPHGAEVDTGSYPVVTSSQLVQLVDELLVLHTETRYTILALVGVVGVIALAALAISVVVMTR
jgi:hypothetical protein